MEKELIAKAKETNTVEELMTLAKENGIRLTEEEAKTTLQSSTLLRASCPTTSLTT